MRRFRTSPRTRTLALISLFVVVLAALPVAAALLQPKREAAAAEPAPDWHKDWALADGFSLDIDTQGYKLPSALAFVPQPGSGPKDPLYFVNELRGTVKVVTNDRSVYTFAENFVNFTPEAELPSGRGQGGLTGLCLDQEHGYVFTTFIYQDERGALRNNIVRFSTKPGTFDITPSAQTAFTDVFSEQDTGLAHQVGPCTVKDDMLYVGIGEGWQPLKTQDIDSMLGKIIRMTLDGKPVADNPFYADGDIKKPRNYVWAYGLRNPFGMSLVGDSVFVGDNGNNVDRFVKVERGQNYMWNGNDASIATNADFVFVPSLGPAQMQFLPKDAKLFPPQFNDTFYLSSSSGNQTPAGVVRLPYDFEHDRLATVPDYLMKYIGPREQMVVGLAFGPDGMYVAPIYPDQQGQSPILKVRYDPENQHPYGMLTNVQGEALVREKGCMGCHRIDGKAGYGGSAGPPLNRDTLPEQLMARLNSQSYLDQLARMDELDSEPQRSYKQAREEVRQAQGMDRVAVWLKYRVLEPRFDSTSSQMPNLGLSEQEAKLIVSFLMEEQNKDSSLMAKAALIGQEAYKYRKHAMAFAGGIIVAGLGFGGQRLLARRRARTAKKQA